MRLRFLHSVYSDALSAIAVGIATQATLLVSGIIVARLLGAEGRGHLALLVLIPGALSIMGALGLPLAVTYYVARDASCVRSVFRALAVPFLIQVVVLLVVHIAALRLLLGDSDGARTAGFVSLVSMPALMAHQYGLAVLQALQQYRAYNTFRVLPPALYAAGVILVLALGTTGLVGITVAWVITVCIASAVTVAVAMRHVANLGPGGPGPDAGTLLRFGIRSVLGSYSPIDTFRLDQLVIGIILSPAALGLYVVALAFTNLPRFIAQSTGGFAYPRVATAADPTAGQRTMWNFFRVYVAVILPIVLVLEIAVGLLLPAFFGAAFSDAVTVARILIVSAALLGARRVLSDGFRGLGYPAASSAGEFLFLVVLMPTLVAGAALWGLTGAAIAITASSAVALLALAAIIRYVLHRANGEMPPADVVTAPNFGSFGGKLAKFPPRTAGVGLLVLIGALVLGGASTLVAPSILLIAVSSVAIAIMATVTIRGRRSRGFAPGLVLAPVLFLEYVGRPAAIILSGRWGWNFYSRENIDALASSAFIQAQLIATSAIIAMSVTYVLLAARQSPDTPRAEDVHRPGSRLLPPIILGFLVSGAGIAALGTSPGDISQLAVRSISTSGYLYSLCFAVTGGILASILSASREQLRTWQVMALIVAAIIGASVLYSLFLGGRSDIIVLIISATVLLSFRLRTPSLLLLGTLAFLLVCSAVGYRVMVREPFFAANEGLSSSELAGDALDSPLETLFSAGDLSAFDKLIAIEDSWNQPLLGGKTLLATFTAPVPRTFLVDKPEGGNEAFTAELYPARYLAGQGLDGVSLFGEWYINFGIPGPAAGGILLTALLVLSQRLAWKSQWMLLLYALLLARVPGVIRGDLVNSAIGLGVPLFWTYVFMVVSRAVALPSIGSRRTTRRTATQPSWEAS